MRARGCPKRPEGAQAGCPRSSSRASGRGCGRGGDAGGQGVGEAGTPSETGRGPGCLPAGAGGAEAAQGDAEGEVTSPIGGSSRTRRSRERSVGAVDGGLGPVLGAAPGEGPGRRNSTRFAVGLVEGEGGSNDARFDPMRVRQREAHLSHVTLIWVEVSTCPDSGELADYNGFQRGEHGAYL